jgi:signal transduction histidine kinase
VTLERTNLPPVSLLMTLETIDYGDGGASGVLVALRDADTRRKIRADLDTARRLSAISRITSGVGHEIKNPLNAMMLHLQIAKDKLERQADCRPALDIIGLELLRLDRVVKALLDFERPLEPVMARCDLTQVASDVAVLIGPQATAQGVRVVVEPYADGAFIDADADLFKQALLNVAVNGLEAMPSGGLLQFRVEWSGSEYFVSVCDDGPGIPPEIRDKIFNLYFTTKKAGTGVGLAMTYRIMLLNGGTITVESDVGKGSCFRLGFPAPSVTRQEETEPTGTPLTYS